MNDLDTLRPEVAEAIRLFGAVIEELGLHDNYESALHVLCAELLRLAKENRILEVKNRGTLANNLCPDHRDKQAGRQCLACLLEHAEAELVALKNENAQLREVLADRNMDRDMAAHANKELAALKARIGASRLIEPGIQFPVPGYVGKRVRLVVEG